MYISNDSNVILKYCHFVLLVVFFKSPSFILLMLSNGPPSSIVLAHRYIFSFYISYENKTAELQLLKKYDCDQSSVIKIVKMKYNRIDIKW